MSSPPVTQGTILLVDDEEANLYALRLILESKGYRCIERSSGEEAIEAAVESKPDVILLDIQMPDMDGYAVCRKLKADGRTAHVPIVFLTARYRDHSEIARGLEVGAYDYVTKPFDTAELTARIGVMMRIRRAEDEARQASLTDSLTGLHNRRFLHHRLDEELSRSERHGVPLSAVMLDLDHFKKINDSHGHAVGDNALRDVAAILRKHIRKSDIAVRYGGEEFVLVLFSTDAEAARMVAERVRADVEQLAVRHAGGEVHLTVSVGIASFPENGIKTVDDLMRRADEALYKAKGAGRNMVCLA
ncbi:MAG TPA: diguanylate cyclase [Candidatus Saccharimonadales bacterium]|nr:diguanylate cyclase [Candidatus Saccharimonadales bacterium]